MVDAKVAASAGTNLGIIPSNYCLTFGSGPQIIHVDTAVTRTGKPSIRLDQHTASDVNYCREVDGTWYKVKRGTTSLESLGQDKRKRSLVLTIV